MSINFRRNYMLVILLIVLVTFLTFVLGDMRVTAYTNSTQSAADEEKVSNINYTNETDLFDDTLVHEIQVMIDQEDYDLMLATYQEIGLKEYFKADVIIDGVRINDVGVRLKGNASLRTALGGGMGFGGGDRPDNAQPPADGDMQQMLEEFAQGERPEPPDGFQMPEAGQGPGGNRGNQEISEDQVKIPFMIKFDEYVEGQTYHGHSTIAIRNYGTSYDEALLQEPITNFAAQFADVPATETVYTGFRFNDNEEKLYVVSELINEEYLEKYFENEDGVLYKAELDLCKNWAWI